MSNPKKPSTDELYADRQWRDNMSFSRKAMDESKRKTGQLEEGSAPATGPLKPKPPSLGKYVNEMNQEINRMSDAVSNRLDNLGSKLTKGFGRLVKPIGQSVTEVADSAAEGLKTMGDGIGKAMIQEFTTVVRNIGDKVAVPQKPQAELPASEEEAPGTGALALPAANVNLAPLDWHFGKILEKKIFFSTIHNRPFLTERDIQAYHPDDLQLMHDWMKRGLDEIHNCAPYGQKLPTPQKGPYTGIPMYDILLQVKLNELQRFLGFVYHRPQPFQTKALKLSEAFATWAHKGAPEN